MARTRQTARKSTSGSSGEHRNNMCSNPHNKEMLKRLIQRNCMVTMKNSLQDVVQEDRIDIHTKFAPYRDCMKLPRLWILKDLLDQQNNPIKCDGIDSSLLPSLPMDVKIEIISFIPTYSDKCGGGSYSDKRGALKKYLSIQDPWFFTYIKNRLISQSVRIHLEQMIFKRMAQETLDLSVFLAYITPNLFDYRVKVIRYLLKEQNRFLNEKSTEYKYLNLPKPEPIYYTKDPLSPIDDDSETDSEKDVTTLKEDDCDLLSMDVDKLDALEKSLLQELPNQTIVQTPFQLEKKPQALWALLDSVQDNARNEIHTALTYYEPYQNSFNAYDEDEDILIDEKSYNDQYVKSVKFGVTDTFNVHLCAQMVMQMSKLEKIELELYDFYEGNRNVMSFLNILSDDCLEKLESITITYFERLSASINHFTLIRKISSIKNVILKAIVDTTDFNNISTLYPSFNIYCNNIKIHGDETKEQNIFIGSINASDVKQSTNPLFSSRAIISIINSGRYPLDDIKEAVHVVLKKYPTTCKYFNVTIFLDLQIVLRLEEILEHLISKPTTAAILQYIIYLTNTYHGGEIFFNNITQPMKETSIAFLVLSGWDLSNQVLQIFGSSGPDFGELILNHWSQLLKQNLCKLDIVKVRNYLAMTITQNRFCKILAFICDHCTSEEKFELLKPFMYGTFGEQYIETSLVNIICGTSDNSAFSFILKYLTPEILLLKSQKATPEKTKTATSLQYLIENVRVTNESISSLIEMQPLLVHISDNEGITPLHQICKKSVRWNLIPLLLKYNVDIHAKDSKGDTPADYLKRNFPFYKYLFPYLNEITNTK